MKKSRNNSRMVSWMIFFIALISVVILLVGIIVYYVVIPNVCGKVISFEVWLFTDSQNILETLHNQEAGLPQINSIIGMRLFWWAWLVCFITSLFLLGRQLQSKPLPDAANAILTRREPYFMIQDVSSSLKQIRQRVGGNKLDNLVSAIKRLEEKLSVESDFGCGTDAVINCENKISTQIQCLANSVPYIEIGNLDESIINLNVAVSTINSLLQRRIELKKR